MDWKRFEHEVPGEELITKDEADDCYYEYVPEFVEENGYLPIECRECYEALIFWTYSRDNINRFNKMLISFPVSVYGKYDENVVVCYFKARDRMLYFLDVLEAKMVEFGVKGRIQWRVSGKYWQRSYPHLFKSVKELYPIKINDEITMKEWLKRKGKETSST